MKTFLNKYKAKLVWILGCLLLVIGVGGIVMSNFAKPSGESERIHLLCIGVDKNVPMDERVEESNSLGQADGLFLLSIDFKKKEMDIVSIPRDTMVTIEKYYSDMEYIGKEEAQICLQYAYADGLENSCELMVDRVEEVFEGIEIDGYISINMAAVFELNDAVGGVKVQVDDGIAAAALGVEKGSEVTLTSDGMEYFLRVREKKESEGAYERTLRYKEYITAFIPQGIEAVKENPKLVADMFKILDENMVTNMSVTDFVNLSAHMMQWSLEDIHYSTLEGKVVLGEDGYEEFYPDKMKLNQLIKRIY